MAEANNEKGSKKVIEVGKEENITLNKGNKKVESAPTQKSGSSTSPTGHSTNSTPKKKLSSSKAPSSRNNGSRPSGGTGGNDSNSEKESSKSGGTSKDLKNKEDENDKLKKQKEQEEANKMFKDDPSQKPVDKKAPPTKKEGDEGAEAGRTQAPKPSAGQESNSVGGRLKNGVQNLRNGANNVRDGVNAAKQGVSNIANAPRNLVNKAGEGIKNAGKNAAKNVGKAAANVAKRLAGMALKAIAASGPIGWIIIGVVLLILIICIMVNMLLDQDAVEGDIDVTVKTIESMQEAINSGEVAGDINQVNQASTLYDSYGSYLGYTKDQVDYIYNQAVDTTNIDSTSTRYALIQLYKTKYGTGEQTSSDGLLKVSDYRELYKHILYTEKYNFNEIEWVNYNHNSDDSRTLTSDDMTIDADMGVQYPTDSSMTYQKFMDLASPYLLSNYIPLSFLVSSLTAVQGDVFSSGMKSNQEMLQDLVDSGVISSTSVADVLDNQDSLAYQILLNCMSDITINQYQLQNYVLDTYYRDYDSMDYHEEFTVTETTTVTYTYTYDSKGNVTGETSTTEVTYTYNNDLKTVADESTKTHHNTRWNENQEEDVMNETVVQNYTFDEIVYYVKYAKCFDTAITNNYTYTKYSDSDVASRSNAASESHVESDYYENLNEDNVITTVTVNSTSDMDNYGTYAQQGETLTGTPALINNGRKETTTKVYKVTGNTYTINDGVQVDITRQWKDEVTASGSDTKALNVSDVIDFNNNYEYEDSQTPISETEFKESDDYSYYEELATNKMLNLVDVMDSNYYVYTNYVEAGNSRSTYIGLGRDDILVSTTYDSILNTYLDTIADNNKLNYVWGSSLGYETSSPSGSSSGSSSYGSAYSLMIQLLHEFEGGGTVYQNSEGVDCYKVLNVNGNLTVGYGIDITVNPQWKTQLESLMGTTISEGTLVPCEYVDAIEEDFINSKLTSIQATLSSNGIELKTYQIHALLIRMYNTGNISGFASAYNSYYKEDTDDKYEEVYEQYSSEPDNVSAITSCAELTSELYNNYLSTPVTSNGTVLSGLQTRRKEEYYLFSLGYYTHNNFHAFYTEGLSFNGIQCVNTDGSIDLDAVYELQTALEDAVFDGKLHAGVPTTSNPWGTAASTNTSDNTDNLGYLSSTYASFFATAYYYQCPWWSRGRANIYLNSVDPDTFSGQFIRDGLGNGNVLAQNIATAYGVTYYTDISQITENCIISWNHGSYGHTAYVEAVGDDYIVISHCGSGVSWHGVTLVSKSTGNISSSYTFAGFVKMDDIVAKYSNK